MSLVVDIARIERGTADGPVPLVDDISFTLAEGATLGIVGESGSGKSVLALSLMGLLPPALRAVGRVELDGADLLAMREHDLQRVRGARIAMIFQEPMTALNPVMRIGEQVAEGLVWHKGWSRGRAEAEALRLLERVRIPDARARLRAYPHELSGGQRQRVCIAMALAPGPALLLADEPTTALDVTIQAEILDLLADVVAERDMALIIISHDLGVIGAVAGTTLVMYGGTVVERGPTAALFDRPRHPYTRALLAASPRAAGADALPGRRLASIPGGVPRPGEWPPGCRFATRCTHVTAVCSTANPPWVAFDDGAARCVHAQALS
jgi:peptide/nickel transport system ATP-binding protein